MELSMKDTSFAIHPGTKKKLEGTDYRDIGNLVSYTIKDNGSLIGYCEKGFVRIFFYKADIVRVMMDPKKEPVVSSSHALVAEPTTADVEVKERDSYILMETSKLTVHLQKVPFRVRITDGEGRTCFGKRKRDGAQCYR